MDTGNGNSWKTFRSALAQRSAADILLGQETKLFTAGGLKTATGDARNDGWNPVFTAAHPTSGTMGSAGNAVLAKKGTGIRPVLRSGISDATEHRLTLAWVDAVLRGGIYCLSVYLRHSEGMSEANQAILDDAAIALRSLRGPWIAAGDWNITPQVLADSRWLEVVGGVICATELPTCHDSVYDYFVVHRSLAKAVVGVQRLQDGGMNPHWASRLLIRGDARRYAVRKLVKPPQGGTSIAARTCGRAAFLCPGRNFSGATEQD